MDLITPLLQLGPNQVPSIKRLLERAAGRFYTPRWMAKRLVEKLFRGYRIPGSALRVVDPFCGDGRLLVALVEHAATIEKLAGIEWHFELWDNNCDSLAKAGADLNKVVRASKAKASVVVRQWDSFLESSSEFGKFHLVVTNPPWESLKPDSRELVGIPTDVRCAFEASLRDYDNRLAEHLPNSQPSTKLYGWGTNLSRCGLEVSICLLHPAGRCGIVLPSSVLADQVSSPLRKWLLERGRILSVDYYPAEAKPFERVDQPSVVAVVKRSERPGIVDPIFSKFDRNHKEVISERVRLKTDDLQLLDYRIPAELTCQEVKLLLKLGQFRPLSDWDVSRGGGLWMGRELDETGYKAFVCSRGKFAFLKGRELTRFSTIRPKSLYVKDGAREIPKSANHQRVGWRDVSRRSQVRRMHASLIPPGIVTGNSLHVAYFADEDPDRLHALLGLLNSLVFEFQLRSRLGTGHISLGSVRGVRVPDLNDPSLVRVLAKFVRRALSGDKTAEIDIEIELAGAFSLSWNERDTLLNHFPGLPTKFTEVLRERLKSAKK